MANSNPYQARAAKRSKAAQRTGSPEDLQMAVWDAISVAVEIVRNPNADAATRLRAVHAVTQAAGAYTKVYEAVELDARLRAVEDEQAKGASL